MNESEYFQCRTKVEFLEWIDTVNNNRIKNNQANDYRARKKLWKKYADEAEPLGRFLRSIKKIDDRSIIKMGSTNKEPDAIIYFKKNTLEFEITTTDSIESVHNRNQLNLHEFGPGETNAVTTSKQLAAYKSTKCLDSGCVMNEDQMIQNELKRIKERIEKKLLKKYSKNTILIVDSTSTSLINTSEIEVINFLKSLKYSKKFYEIYIIIYPSKCLRVFKRFNILEQMFFKLKLNYKALMIKLLKSINFF